MKNELSAFIASYTEEVRILNRRDAETYFTEAALAWSEKTVEGWNTLLIAAFPYNNGEDKPPYGIARYAWGRDYHKVSHEALSPTADLIEKNGGQSFIFCDTSPVPERELAAAAGLGVIGKNGLLITEKYGSYVTLAGMLIRCEKMEGDSMLPIGGCIGCGACIKSCPGGALTEEGFVAEHCISALTQKRGELTEKEQAFLRENGAVWGCDICQDVCPMNRKVRLTEIQAYHKDLIKNITPAMVMLSHREFMRQYGDRAFSWRGVSVLRRNLEINGIK